MRRFIRFVGIINAAVWFGAAIFFTVLVGPTFFSPEMSFLPRPYVEHAAEIMVGRYFTLQTWCGGIAVVHLLAEYLYGRRGLDKLLGGVLATMWGLGLATAWWLLPEMHRLQLVKYSPHTTLAQKAQAANTFLAWHAVAQSVNLLAMLGLLYYLWRLTQNPIEPRFATLDKFDKFKG